jgi:hypothetical protein
MTSEDLVRFQRELDKALADPTQWQIVRPSPIHQWGAALVARGVVIAEISEPVAAGIEKLKAAVAEEREACARMADEVVREHRDRQREVWGPEVVLTSGEPVEQTVTTAEEFGKRTRCGDPGYFCEDFGCGSFEELAAAIRARP